MINKDVVVSVCCVTYNHENYIRQCIEAILSQETSFNYEVLIHDDASTDSTQSIVKEYELKYPDRIRAVYQVENQWVKNNRNPLLEILFPMVEGKYIALCEGDDYWTDSSKLQKQVDLLEKHPEYVICHHAFDTLQQGGLIVKKDRNAMNILKPIISFEDILEFPYPKTLTVMFKRKALTIHNFLSYLRDIKMADIGLWHLILLSGKGYFINEAMGCYRSNPSGITNSMVSNYAVTKAKISILEKLINANVYPNVSLMREYLSKHYQTLFLNEGSWIYFVKAIVNRLRSRYLFKHLEIRNRVTVGGLLVGLRKKVAK
jgi:glycosyltransferase involved in cell wall biosynthesis